ncbi:hypothetical protein ACNKHP_08820 [Shigella boydii]
MIHRQAGELELELISDNTLQGIRGNGIEKVLAGETSLDKVMRVTSGGVMALFLLSRRWSVIVREPKGMMRRVPRVMPASCCAGSRAYPRASLKPG